MQSFWHPVIETEVLSCRPVTTILAAMLEKTEIINVVAQATAKVSGKADTLVNKLGVIKVKDLKDILEGMGKSDW